MSESDFDDLDCLVNDYGGYDCFDENFYEEDEVSEEEDEVQDEDFYENVYEDEDVYENVYEDEDEGEEDEDEDEDDEEEGDGEGEDEEVPDLGLKSDFIDSGESDEDSPDDFEQEFTIDDYENKTEKKMERKEKSTVKSRKRNRKSKKGSTRPPKRQKVESTLKVSKKSKMKSRKKQKLSAEKRTSLKKNRKKRPHVKIDPGAIRKYSASKVKIPKESTRWARKMATTHIESIRKYCINSYGKEIFSHFEFTGSFYEHLKTEDADELDIIVALDTKNNADLKVEKVVPGYALIKVTKKSSKYHELTFLGDKGYVHPTLVRSWFFGLVQKAVNMYDKDKQEKDPELKLSANGPATTLLIVDKENKSRELKVDLVPAFLFKPKKADRSSAAPVKATRYVAKSLPEEIEVDNLKYPREMLWRQSFSFEEKKIMEKMDAKDEGCRHEIVKVIKTIKKNDTTLAQLSSYHIKTAFLHFNFDTGQENLEWSRKHLTERFLGLMEYLRQRVSEKNLSHFFIKELNLLEGFSPSSLDNIENRLSKLISNEKELKKALMPSDSKLKRRKPNRR